MPPPSVAFPRGEASCCIPSVSNVPAHPLALFPKRPELQRPDPPFHPAEQRRRALWLPVPLRDKGDRRPTAPQRGSLARAAVLTWRLFAGPLCSLPPPPRRGRNAGVCCGVLIQDAFPVDSVPMKMFLSLSAEDYALGTPGIPPVHSRPRVMRCSPFLRESASERTGGLQLHVHSLLVTSLSAG